jgi:DNA replication protein DnaC
MSTAIAKNLMAEMKLLGMFAAFDQGVTDATRDQTSYTEFLDNLLQAEADYRQERKTGYRIKAAKFTLRPAFEDIDFTASRSISADQGALRHAMARRGSPGALDRVRPASARPSSRKPPGYTPVRAANPSCT